VGVARDWGTALNLTFEFADAGAELVVKLLLLDEQRGLRGERRPGPGEFLREPRDESLLGANNARFGVGDPTFELLEIAEYDASALRVEAEEGAFVDHSAGSGAGSR
jgi:hypothetical protein